MIFNIITVILCVLAVFQPTHDRRMLAICYALVSASHGVVCGNFEGFWYFFSAGVFDLSIISIVYAYGARTRLTDDLINISVASVALNFYGWLTWYSYQPPISYNLAMTALYFIAILSILRKDCANGNQPHSWHNGVRLFIDKSLAVCHTKQKEART